MPKKKRLSIEELKKLAKSSKTLNVPSDFYKVQEMARAYEDALKIYLHRPTLKYLKGIVKPKTRSYTIWLKTAFIASELDMEYDRYMKAMFYYSNKIGNRAPTPSECCSLNSNFTAPMRALLFRDTIEGTWKDPGTVSKAITRPAPSVPDVVKFKNSERTMRVFCNNFNISQEEMFKKFCKGDNAYLFFEEAWLNQNETYQKLLKLGEL